MSPKTPLLGYSNKLCPGDVIAFKVSSHLIEDCKTHPARNHSIQAPEFT